MNKKGFEFGIGSLIMVFVAIVVAVALLTGGISGGVGTLTQTSSVTNAQITAPAVNATITLNGQAVSGFSMVNGTSGTTIPATNYTITNNVVSNGQLVTTLKALDGGGFTGWAGKLVNVTYTYEPFGYDTNSGGRAIAQLIIIFCAIAIFVVVLTPVLRNGIIDLVS